MLDGLRGVAALTVVLYHAAIPGFRGGFIAVDVFFVLSGFLITSLLIAEFDKAGTLRLRDFYARRALRLLPALFAFIGLISISVMVFGPADYRSTTIHGIPYGVFYVANFHQAFGWQSSNLGFLDGTWSLSGEEQFYLLWPVGLIAILRFVKRRDRVWFWLVAAAALVGLYRTWLAETSHSYIRLYYGPDTHIDGLLLGCALAFYLSGSPAPRPRWLRPASILGTGYLLAVLLREASSDLSLYDLHFGLSLVSASAAIILWDLRTSTPRVVGTVLNSRPLTYLGAISYGMYLWNFAVLRSLPLGSLPRALGDPLGVGAVLVVASLSYRYVEKPFLRWKARLSIPRMAPAAPAPAAATIVG